MEGVFTAGDGDLSIVFQSAAHLWGSWGATYSEGVEAEDFEEDRTLGFVGDVGDTGGELASRMWVRADVAMDQDAQTSTVPQVFRDARERTSGEVVVQREVSGLGLGRLVPYVHFRHSDEIGTVVGSKVVPLPVNSIEYTTDVDGKTDYVVTVGKGLLGNTRERDARNAVLEAQIRRETAERDRRIAEEAKREAEKAVRPINTDLDKALDLYDGGKLGIGKDDRFTWITEQNQQADAAIDGKVYDLNSKFTPVQSLVNEQIGVNGALRRTVGTMDGIVNGSNPPKVNSNLWKLNNDAWKLQNAFNSAQTAINTWTTSAIDVLDKRIPYTMTITNGGGLHHPDWGWFRITGNNYRFEKSYTYGGRTYTNRYPCRITIMVAVDALDSWAVFDSATLGVGTNAYESFTGHFQVITSATIIISRTDAMPRLSLPQVSL